MTDIRMTKCDGCGQVTDNPRHGWFVVEIKVGDSPSGDTIHFDSWDCLGRYAVRKAREQGEEND